MNHWVPVAHPKDLAARHLLACAAIEVSLISDGDNQRANAKVDEWLVAMVDPKMTLKAYLGSRHQRIRGGCGVSTQKNI